MQILSRLPQSQSGPSEKSIPAVGAGAGLILGCLFLTGCSGEDRPQNDTRRASVSPDESRHSGSILPVKPSHDYFFQPPVLAPDSFNPIVSSAGKFTEREARYLNDCVFFLRKTLEAGDRPDLVAELDKLRFEPMPRERLEAAIPGGSSAQLTAIYDSGVVYINTASERFIDRARGFITLSATVAHEFCHHIGRDKTITDLDADLSYLFSMEAVAHGRTRTMCALMRKFVENMPDISPQTRAISLREIAYAELFARAEEIRYKVRGDICQKIYNLVDEAGTELRKRGLVTVDIDQKIGGLMLLALQLRDAPENGQDELQGYRVLTFETREFVSKFMGPGADVVDKLRSELESMSDLLSLQEAILGQMRPGF